MLFANTQLWHASVSCSNFQRVRTDKVAAHSAGERGEESEYALSTVQGWGSLVA